MKISRQLRDSHQKAIVKLFEKLTYRHSRWNVWSDFVSMAACTLSLMDIERRPERIRTYNETAKKYNANEMDDFRDMFEKIVQALEENPDQDFLGEIFMALELGNKHNGQFFTPYSVCTMMAKMQTGDIKAEVEDKGYITVNDPAVGAGALLIAYANECRAREVNYQQHVLFVGQDIDYVAAMMCYIQISLLGCPGFVIIGDTLSTPPTVPLGDRNVWYTPMYFSNVWVWRRLIKSFGALEQSGQKEIAAVAAPMVKKSEEMQLTLF